MEPLRCSFLSSCDFFLFEKLKAHLLHSSEAEENVGILIVFISAIRDEQVEGSEFI